MAKVPLTKPQVEERKQVYYFFVLPCCCFESQLSLPFVPAVQLNKENAVPRRAARNAQDEEVEESEKSSERRRRASGWGRRSSLSHTGLHHLANTWLRNRKRWCEAEMAKVARHFTEVEVKRLELK